MPITPINPENFTLGQDVALHWSKYKHMLYDEEDSFRLYSTKCKIVKINEKSLTLQKYKAKIVEETIMERCPDVVKYRFDWTDELSNDKVVCKDDEKLTYRYKNVVMSQSRVCHLCCLPRKYKSMDLGTSMYGNKMWSYFCDRGGEIWDADNFKDKYLKDTEYEIDMG